MGGLQHAVKLLEGTARRLLSSSVSKTLPFQRCLLSRGESHRCLPANATFAWGNAHAQPKYPPCIFASRTSEHNGALAGLDVRVG